MSVRTTADERVEEAREQTKAALKSLTDVVCGDAWGHDEYRKEFFQKLVEAHGMLITALGKLNNV